MQVVRGPELVYLTYDRAGGRLKVEGQPPLEHGTKRLNSFYLVLIRRMTYHHALIGYLYPVQAT